MFLGEEVEPPDHRPVPDLLCDYSQISFDHITFSKVEGRNKSGCFEIGTWN